MKLKQLFKDLPAQFHGSKEVVVTGLSADSKRIAPGSLFLAKRGKTYDGTQFLSEAVKHGAAAILTDVFDPFLGKITQIIHPDPASLEADLAVRFYQNPSQELSVVGVTGTSGKTTTTYLIRHILERMNISCGLIGTVEYLMGNVRLDASHTTPDAISLQKLFREMRHFDCKAAVIEVSSHALDQKRVEKTRFQVAVFTNLQHEHLDYHQTMEEYGAAKQKLFAMLGKEAFAVVNGDSSYSSLMLAGCKARPLFYGIEKEADVMAKNLTLHPQGMSFQVEYKGESEFFQSSLIGRFNVYNILAALTSGIAMGFSLSALKECIASFQTVPGRLQRVLSSKTSIFVDYAHKPDALLNVLQTLQEIRKGKIITVFGCGGNRDRLKRPLMAKIAEDYSDMVIVTSDNPRNEAPEAIVEEIVQGFKKGLHRVEVDREKAIRKAISLAGKDDIVLIAGKGHEKVQVFAHKTIPFDDVEIARFS